MIDLNPQFVIDTHGRRTGVLMDIEDYDRLAEELDELDAIRAYDAAKADGDEAVSFNPTMNDIERDRM